MSDLSKIKSSNSNRIAWATGILCVACCAAPFIGVAVGSATLAAFAFYSEGTAIAIAVLGITLLGYKFISRRRAPSCDLECSCRPTQNNDNEPKTN